LTVAFPVDPAEAVLCRWLADPAFTREQSQVVALACGETWTMGRGYRIQSSANAVAIDPLPVAGFQLPLGSAAVVERLTRAVLARCREEIPATALLPLAGGVLEYLATLGSSPTDSVVNWEGPLADRMFAPFHESRSRIALWPESLDATAAVESSVRDILGVFDGSATILVGGIGAAGALMSDALARHARVWTSPRPELALAVGAAWRWHLRTAFRKGPAVAARKVTEPAKQSDIAVSAAPDIDPLELPPWMRDQSDEED
jgi:hypothetical protein